MRWVAAWLVVALGVGIVTSHASAAFIPVTGDGWTDTQHNGIPFDFGPWLLTTHHPPIPAIPDPSTPSVSAFQYDLPSLFHADRIHFLSALAFSHWVPQDTVVGELRSYYTDGTFDSKLLIAGIDTSEWAWDRPEAMGTVLHDRAEVGYSYLTTIDSAKEYEAHWYYSNADTNPEKVLQRVTLIMADDMRSNTSQWLNVGIPAVTVEGSVIPEPASLAVWSILGCVGLAIGWRSRRVAQNKIDRPRVSL